MKNAIIILIALALPGCIIAPYDAPTDLALSSIQSRVDQHLSALQNPPATQPASEFYPAIENDLHSLLIRLGARQQGDPSIDAEQEALQAVGRIVERIHALEVIATTRPAAPIEWNIEERLFDAGIGAVLKLELKRK